MTYDRIVAQVHAETVEAVGDRPGAPLPPRHVELVTREVARHGDFACITDDVVHQPAG